MNAILSLLHQARAISAIILSSSKIHLGAGAAGLRAALFLFMQGENDPF
jgi:hypothetical protein